ncbi:hypothetical protein ElyMa_000921500 [Elysia marginata]|uniref:Secreted protein n=1 Tax=Elysia marginata TaxID=1093978 RepID=A0AAV4HA00_9GAST|nr:hypothetical protein ElyMa_000921500 [Elysia marginata]
MLVVVEVVVVVVVVVAVVVYRFGLNTIGSYKSSVDVVFCHWVVLVLHAISSEREIQVCPSRPPPPPYSSIFSSPEASLVTKLDLQIWTRSRTRSEITCHKQGFGGPESYVLD